MSNICEICFEIETPNTATAKKLCKFMQEAQKQADSRNEGVFIGSEEVPIISSASSVEGATLIIAGNVAWGFEDTEFAKVIRWFQSKAEIIKLKMEYEELLSLAFGEYEYTKNGAIPKMPDAELLIHRFLPEEEFPDDEFDDDDEFEKQVLDSFKKKKRERIVSMD